MMNMPTSHHLLLLRDGNGGGCPRVLITTQLIAGTKKRDELEGRVTTLLKDIKKSGNVIVFIDEVYTLIGSGTVGRGNKGSSLDIANLLKPSLGRGKLQVIFLPCYML
ncbi:unnamed protein product [Coffea canephora]|uniref:ATPase AAA-type core domain-containing protein n=1 Tax=Coffea canephora TaxID=49390 RepID=A0A068V6F4_COFCA|nr:unnamed protein product [Coffea canephora]